MNSRPSLRLLQDHVTRRADMLTKLAMMQGPFANMALNVAIRHGQRATTAAVISGIVAMALVCAAVDYVLLTLVLLAWSYQPALGVAVGVLLASVATTQVQVIVEAVAVWRVVRGGA